MDSSKAGAECGDTKQTAMTRDQTQKVQAARAGNKKTPMTREEKKEMKKALKKRNQQKRAQKVSKYTKKKRKKTARRERRKAQLEAGKPTAAAAAAAHAEAETAEPITEDALQRAKEILNSFEAIAALPSDDAKRTQKKYKKKGKSSSHHDKKNRGRKNDDDRSTRQLVLDKYTRGILLKLVCEEFLMGLGRQVRSGKEAACFYAQCNADKVKAPAADKVKTPAADTSKTPTADTAKTPATDMAKATVTDQTKKADAGDDGTATPPGVATDDGTATPPGVAMDCVVKIFKTMTQKFSTKAEYVEGDHRFRNAAFGAQHSTLKKSKLWCEKEFKNLQRMFTHGVPCPRPLHFRDHVLAMQFIGRRVGSEMVAAPQLREVELAPPALRSAYVQMCAAMKLIFQECELVHGDLSEYNTLYMDQRCWVIDVGQAVHTSHPRASEFLFRDCKNVTDFFCRRGLSKVLTYQQLYDFILKPEPPVEAKADSVANVAPGGVAGGVSALESAFDIMLAKAPAVEDVAAIEGTLDLHNEVFGRGWKADLRTRLATNPNWGVDDTQTLSVALQDMTTKGVTMEALAAQVCGVEVERARKPEPAAAAAAAETAAAAVMAEAKPKQWFLRFKQLRVGMQVRVCESEERAVKECRRCTVRSAGACTMYWGTRTAAEVTRKEGLGQVVTITEKDKSDLSVEVALANRKRTWYPAAIMMRLDEAEAEGSDSDDEDMPTHLIDAASGAAVPIQEEEEEAEAPEVAALRNKLRQSTNNLAALREKLANVSGKNIKTKRKRLHKRIEAMEATVGGLQEQLEVMVESDGDESDEQMRGELADNISALEEDLEQCRNKKERRQLKQELSYFRKKLKLFEEYSELQKRHFSLQERIDHLPAKDDDSDGDLKRAQLQRELTEIDARMHEIEEAGLSEEED